ncbi:hypothetical protein GCM10027290_59880 [Micromonospora sonneratiae]|uniref:Uncharacterized protein n=1 Tax=Micromonospora sonneratiae TaxID=1184706 RepID=A0ABW3YMF5_9ACTN
MAETTEAAATQEVADAAWAVWQGVAELRRLAVAVPADRSGSRVAVLNQAAATVRRAAEVVERVRQRTEEVGSPPPEGDPTVAAALAQWQVGVGCLDLLAAWLLRRVAATTAYAKGLSGVNLGPLRRPWTVGLRQQADHTPDWRYAGVVAAGRLVVPARRHRGPAGGPRRYDHRLTLLGHDQLLAGYADRLSAAFVLAVRRRFPPYDTTGVRRFVAGMTDRYDPPGTGIDMVAAEELILATIGDAEVLDAELIQVEPVGGGPAHLAALQTLTLVEVLAVELLDREALASLFVEVAGVGAGPGAGR